MSNIIKQFWRLSQEIILDNFNIGKKIDINKRETYYLRPYENKPNTFEYYGNEEKLWTIVLKEGIINEIYYKYSFPFPNHEFWNDELEILTAKLKKNNQLVEDVNTSEIFLYIVYRDYFPSIIGLVRMHS